MPDDYDSTVAHRLRVIDDIPVPADLWSRVELKALDRRPAQVTEGQPTMIELDTATGTDEQHKPTQRVLVPLRILLAAAAMVAIVLVTIRSDDPVTPSDEPGRTVTVPATVPSRALFGTPGERFDPGTYYVDEVDGVSTPRIFVTLGDGWTNFDDQVIGHDVGGDLKFGRVDRVYADVCHASSGFFPGTVTNLGGLVTALTEQQGWADVTEPKDVAVNGYVGKQFQRTAPADKTGCNTIDAPFRSWETDGVRGPHCMPSIPCPPRYWWYQPQDVETLVVLDLDGTMIIINTVLPGNGGGSVTEALEVINSIIEPVEPDS